jgi:hypothetical protein
MKTRTSLSLFIIIASVALIAPQESLARDNNGIYSSSGGLNNYVKSVKVNGTEILPLWSSGDDNCHYGRKFYTLTINYPGRHVSFTIPSDAPKNTGMVSTFPVNKSTKQANNEYHTSIILPSTNFSDYKKYNFVGSVTFSWDDPTWFSDIVLIKFAQLRNKS